MTDKYFFEIGVYSLKEDSFYKEFDKRKKRFSAVWDSLSADDLPLTDAERALLDARIADMERNPDDQSSLARSKESTRAVKENRSMSTTLIDEAKLKEVLKSAIAEVLEERRDLLRDLLEEALEDIALARAIEEGEQSKLVTRDEVFSALEA